MIWIIIVSILLILFCGILLFEFYVYKRVFYSPQKGQNSEYNAVRELNASDLKERATKLVNELLEIPSEDLYITSFDKLKLHAYFYKCEGSREYIVFFHGFRRTARRSFAGRAMDCLKEHKNVILVDQRAHGLSEGHQLTFGKKEQRDVVSWVNFIQEKFGRDSKITLVGVSMGATAILGASDRIDENIKIVADSPYISIKDVIKVTMARIKMNPKVTYPIVALSSVLYCHSTIECNVSDNVRKSKNRILIIHGSEDFLVPYKDVEALYLANKDHVEYELFEGIGHGLPYLRATEKYRKVFFDFINN